MPKRETGSPSADDLRHAAAFRTELRCFLHASEAIAVQEGLTPERYDLLLMIKAASEAGAPATVTSLRATLDLRQQAVSELVKRAIDVGLVVREPSSDDGRVFHLRLTDEGETRLARAFRALGEARATLAEGFDRLGLHFHASNASAAPARLETR
jgi:DNA-binding MarR family transcriptional regulator